MRFPDLTIADDIPDSHTVWLFREQLVDLGLVEQLFDVFPGELERLSLIVNEGKIIDASFIEVPRQRNKKQENQSIKAGEIPASIQEDPHRKAQKDTDAQYHQIACPLTSGTYFWLHGKQHGRDVPSQ